MNRNLKRWEFLLFFFFIFSSFSAWSRNDFESRSAADNQSSILHAAEASEDVYDVYKDFVAHTENYIQDTNKRGFYSYRGSYTTLLGEDTYTLDSLFCAKEILKNKECGLFIVFYKPGNPKNHPIISVKGTSTFNDWIQNIFNQGRAYVSWFFELLDESSINDLFQDQDLAAITEYLARFMGRQTIMTGHSLGGGLAQSLSLEIADKLGKYSPQIDLIVFNSLAGESLLNKLRKDMKKVLFTPGSLFRALLKIDDKKNYDFNHGFIPEKITAISISTEDDVLQGVNLLISKKNMGYKLTLPSQRAVYNQSGLQFNVDGHRMKSVIADLKFMYNSSNATSFIKQRIEENSSAEGLAEKKRQAMAYYRRWAPLREDPYQTTPTVLEMEVGDMIYFDPERKAEMYRDMLDFMQNSRVRKTLGIR